MKYTIITETGEYLESLYTRKGRVTPKAKYAWIRRQYNKHRDDYSSDQEWAEATTLKFKESFKTTFGSPQSMKRYAIYNGHN